MKVNNVLVFVIAAAAGCGVVSAPGSATGGSDAGSGMDSGSGSGSDPGSGSDSGSGSGTGSGSMIPPNVMIGSILDERNDTIDFSTGEPVHQHGGGAIDLSTGCPEIYKYAYLMDQSSPAFGRELSSNPIAWQVRSDAPDLDPSATVYRLRDVVGTVLLDWTPVAADTHGVYSIVLHRNGDHPIAALGTAAAELHVEVRFHTGSGDKIVSACWNNHPMAAPMIVTPVQPGPLFGMSLPANSAISPLINQGSWASNLGIEVASLSVTQETAEPTQVTISVPQHTGTSTATTLSTYLQFIGGPENVACATQTTGACASPVDNTQRQNKSSALAGTWMLRIVDDHGVELCHNPSTATNVSCNVPPRASNDPPRVYHVGLSLANEPTLAPAAVVITTSTFGEHILGATQFTGSFDGTTSYGGCAHRNSTGSGTSTQWFCDVSGAFYAAQMLDSAKIDFAAVPFTLAVGSGASAMLPAYVDPASLTLSARTWDGGSEGY